MARDLGRLDSSGQSEALGINAQNVIVGWSDSFQGPRAVRFTWNGTEVTRQNLGTLTGSGASKATAISNMGLIVGSSTAGNNADHAFLYDESIAVGPKMLDLHSHAPALAGWSSYALAINDMAWVVGRLTSGGSELAFLWTPGTGMVLLQDLIDPLKAEGWRLSAATGINSRGQIVGYGTLSNGATHAFLLTPTGGPIVPEPSSILLLTLGLAASCGLRARRRRPR
jgi:probable HAF family extracellular repeat protein